MVSASAVIIIIPIPVVSEAVSPVSVSVAHHPVTTIAPVVPAHHSVTTTIAPVPAHVFVTVRPIAAYSHVSVVVEIVAVWCVAGGTVWCVAGGNYITPVTIVGNTECICRPDAVRIRRRNRVARRSWEDADTHEDLTIGRAGLLCAILSDKFDTLQLRGATSCGEPYRCLEGACGV